jgi:hypothetical protein
MDITTLSKASGVEPKDIRTLLRFCSGVVPTEFNDCDLLLACIMKILRDVGFSESKVTFALFMQWKPIKKLSSEYEEAYKKRSPVRGASLQILDNRYVTIMPEHECVIDILEMVSSELPPNPLLSLAVNLPKLFEVSKANLARTLRQRCAEEEKQPAETEG